jgi:DNA primase
MSIPPEFVDELRDRLSIASVIGGRVRLQKRGRDHTGLCPFHKEKTPSFTVSEEKGFFHCFGCGAHGDVVGFVMRSDNLSFPEAVERLARDVGMQVPATSPEERQREERRATLHSVLEAAAAWFEAQLRAGVGRPGLDYLKRRGLQDDTIARFRLGYAPDARTSLKDALARGGFSEALMLEAGLVIRPEDGRPTYDRFRGRVMFPITDRRGRVIAFGGRILDQGEPKYLNSPETPLFHKGRTLYGLARASKVAREGGEIIVCEGYMDAIALDEAGFGGALAPLGTALTEEQLIELWRLVPEPVLCFDGDSAGQRAAGRAAERALPLLQPGKSLRFALLPNGEDPDSFVRKRGAEAFRHQIEDSQPLANVLWHLEFHGKPIATPEQRAGLRRHIDQVVRRIADRLVQESYRRDYAERLYEAFGYKGRASVKKRVFDEILTEGRGTRTILDKYRLRQLVVMYTMLNHPDLLESYDSIFGHEVFLTDSLEKLRQETLLIFLAYPGIERGELQERLRAGGYSAALEAVLSGSVAVHAGFARPTKSTEEAKAGLEDVWLETYQERLTTELERLEQLLVSTKNDLYYQQIRGMKEMLQRMNEDRDIKMVVGYLGPTSTSLH